MIDHPVQQLPQLPVEDQLPANKALPLRFSAHKTLKCPLKCQKVKKELEDKIDYLIGRIHHHREVYNFLLIPENSDEETYQAVHKLDKMMTLAEHHIALINGVLKAKSREEVEQAKEKYDLVAVYYPDLHSAEDISWICTLENLNMASGHFESDMAKVEDGIQKKKYKKGFLRKRESLRFTMLIIASKIQGFLEYFPAVPMLSQDEVFSCSKYSEVWESLQKSVEYKKVATPEEIAAATSRFDTLLSTACVISYKKNIAAGKKISRKLIHIKSVYDGVYSLINRSEARTIAELSFAESDLDNAFRVWNTMDTKWPKRMRRLLLSKNKLEKKIYLPRIFPQITKESLSKEYEDGTIQKINEKPFTAPPLDLSGKESTIKELCIKNKDRVRVRVISEVAYSELVNHKERCKGCPKVCEACQHCSRGILIHIHGGGFVAMSSSVYRKQIAQASKSFMQPVFSIDYRLAPETPYPGALDDVWQAYNWLINYCEPLLGISTNRIIVVGDSAGGNLAFALTLRAIKEGIRVPDGCKLMYPALNMYPKKLTPSYFLAIQDMTLPYKLLNLAVQAYVQEGIRADIDPFCSPIVANDDLLSKLPPMRIGSGTNDPLHDDVWTLIYKMQKLNKDLKVVVYEGLPHSYMHLKIPHREIISQDVMNMIQELLIIAMNKQMEDFGRTSSTEFGESEKSVKSVKSGGIGVDNNEKGLNIASVA